MLKRPIVPAVALAALTGVSIMAEAPLAAQVLEQVLVRVNGEILTKTQLEARQVEILRERPELANASPTSADLQKAIAEITPRLILDLVDELLLLQRGREMGLAVSDAQFNSWVTNIREGNELKDEAEFQEALKQMGMTMSQLRQFFERQVLVTQVQRTEVVDKIDVTEAEARAYYDANRMAFTTPSEITLREILLEVPASEQGINVAQDDAVRARAEELRQRALAGESFAALAGEHSQAPSRAHAGLIGPIRRDDLTPQLQVLLDSLQPGGVTDVLRTARGYQILMLERRTESVARPFQDAYPDISRQVREQKVGQELHNYLDRLRSQANIIWRSDELQRAYNQALDQRRAAQGTPDPASASAAGSPSVASGVR